MSKDYNKWVQEAEKIEEIAHRLGYIDRKKCSLFGTFLGELHDIKFTVSVYPLSLNVEVEIDLEGWECIPGRDYLKDINDAYDYAENIGNKVLEEYKNEIHY